MDSILPELIWISGVGTIDSVIIRRNLIYDDITESLDGVESYQSNGMYIAEESTGNLTNIYIYDNIITNCTNQAINLQSVTSSYVYNNTIYGVNPNLTEVGVPLVGLGGSTSCVFKNNIIYNNAVNTIKQ